METYIFTRLDHYFHTLSALGYYPERDVNRLLFLIHTHKMTREDYQGLLSPEDYRHIEQAIYRLFGDCLLPFPKLYNKRIDNEPPTPWDYKRTRPSHRETGAHRAQAPQAPSQTPPLRPDGRPGGRGHSHHWPDRYGRERRGRRGRRGRHHRLGLWHHLTPEARRQISAILKEEIDRIHKNHIDPQWWERD